MNSIRIREIHRWWTDHLNLKEAFEDTISISLCLDAQRRFNEEHQFEPKFMRMNVPLVIRVFRESRAYKKNNFVNYDEGIKPEIHMFKTKWNPPHVEGTGLIDLERDYLEQLTPEITKEFDALFNDMSNESITFHGFGCLKDGTLTLAFSR